MYSLKPIEASMVKLTVTLKNAPDISDASARMLRLVTEWLTHWYEDRAMNVGYMTDNKLLQNLAISAAVVSALNGRQVAPMSTL